MTEILCTSGAMLIRAGLGRNTTISGAAYVNFITQAEAWVNASTRKNWNDIYSTLNDDVKFILEETVACKAANAVIAYDMGGYNSVEEALNIVNINRDTVKENIKILRDDKEKTFVEET